MLNNLQNLQNKTNLVLLVQNTNTQRYLRVIVQHNNPTQAQIVTVHNQVITVNVNLILQQQKYNVLQADTI